ncbi:chorismate mutase [Streptomyces sp. YIM 130001]|uniref:chorismate mutase family protein n=1 Tax=Streptomyces sp. YIM 130001 TaxID=2259644 RepID=UPI000E65CA22|nr:chorismate mutase family protein [Streptomyces sp. YIM 130001]RII13445.1 chorismate mutase [Streptomyces sp. YIM 130001]
MSLPAGPADVSEDLESLRARLDAVDAALLDTVRERLEICLRIGEYKRVHEVAMMQPHRIATVQGRAARYAQEHGIDPAFLRSLYDTIIAETCRLEDEWIAAGGAAGAVERRAS